MRNPEDFSVSLQFGNQERTKELKLMEDLD
jgi:hypothetical protein